MITSDQDNLDAETYLSRVEVDLSAVRANYRLVRRQMPAGVDVFPVIKADAYGHGAVRVCKALLEEQSVNRVCVARVEEAVELRSSGIDLDILVFTPPFYPQAQVAATHRLEVVACDPVHLDAVQKAQLDSGARIPVHLKIDVGMGRLGAQPAELPQLYRECIERNIQVIGVMSHFPCADVDEGAQTREMIEIFQQACVEVMTLGGKELIFHTSNTAALMRFPEAQFSAVRLGIGLYGQMPDYSMERTLSLSPAMTLKTRIVFIKDVEEGTPVSYCHTWRAKRRSRLATLPLGYADGYPRHGSNKTELVVRGRRVRQVGRVCMDQLLIDVTDVPDVQIGDEVLAFGVDNDGVVLSAEEVAHQCGTIGYELTTRIGKRLPRFYLESSDAGASESNSGAGKQ